MIHHHPVKLEYVSKEYLPFRKRLTKYTPWQLVWIVILSQSIILISLGLIYEIWFLIFAGVFTSIVLANYFFYRKWVKYYIKSIRIYEDSDHCFLEVYEQDELQKLEIPLQNLTVKLQKLQVRGKAKYKLCFYENKTMIFYQLADVEHWTYGLCEEIENSLKHS